MYNYLLDHLKFHEIIFRTKHILSLWLDFIIQTWFMLN
jgi:hypothetical protein